MRKAIFTLLLGIVAVLSSYGQEEKTEEDTLPHYFLNEVQVIAKNRKHSYLSRLEYNVRKVYPYARIAAQTINKIESKLATISDKKERKHVIKEEYRSLMQTFKKPLMKLSFTQGRILIKLIHRETENTAFSHIKEYRGGFNAYFWQSLALLFGNNLKADYDPQGKDAEIEKVVQKILSEERRKKATEK
ncbi:DUF4294 domain-containing protein [Odoribacter lunatus]|uniref:DUF4294 domain-containing protein n=1 Tax=Odoribacter lunatus TaxID=2941335 RepID=UPI00203D2CC2|nr:DUF4294 domain-containing protein [Odoribacter lunatus]